jgi:hypothetical protein
VKRVRHVIQDDCTVHVFLCLCCDGSGVSLLTV